MLYTVKSIQADAGTSNGPGTRRIQLRDCFADSLLDVMNFLNNVTYEYPRAISFAPGRPPDKFFEVEKHLESLRYFVSRKAQTLGKSEQELWLDLGQYNPTNDERKRDKPAESRGAKKAASVTV